MLYNTLDKAVLATSLVINTAIGSKIIPFTRGDKYNLIITPLYIYANYNLLLKLYKNKRVLTSYDKLIVYYSGVTSMMHFVLMVQAANKLYRHQS